MTLQARGYRWSAAIHGTILLAFALASSFSAPPARIALIDFTLAESPALSPVARPEPPRPVPVRAQKRVAETQPKKAPVAEPVPPPLPAAAAPLPPEAPAAPPPEPPPAALPRTAEGFGGFAAEGKDTGPVFSAAPAAAQAGARSGEARPRAAEPDGSARDLTAAVATPAAPTPEASRQAYLREHFTYIRDRINRGISYPGMARKMGWSGQVRIAFIVREDGGVADVKVLESSGFALLDRNALDTVRQVAPFPCPPVRAEIRMAITYRLN